MSRTNVEQALTGLVPTLNGPLPPELIDLAISLLARSRSVAHSLKQDEEIARPYACAQLACERLKKRLDLPTITSRPPCPPRIYKKLYNYLDSALPTSTSRAPETPRKATAQAPASARTTPKTPLSARKTPRSVAREHGKAEELPEWTLPTIRGLCHAFSNRQAVPHVNAGVESTLPLLARMAAATAETPSKRPRRATTQSHVSLAKVPDTQVVALIAVLLFYVLSRMLDQNITPDQFLQWRAKAVSTVLGMKAVVDGMSEADILAEIEQLMPMAQEEGWLQMEWYLNVFPEADSDKMEGVEMTNGGIAPNGQAKSLKDGGSDYIGLGTMMQDATDYLSVSRKADYVRWKANIMARIEAIEAS